MFFGQWKGISSELSYFCLHILHFPFFSVFWQSSCWFIPEKRIHPKNQNPFLVWQLKPAWHLWPILTVDWCWLAQLRQAKEREEAQKQATIDAMMCPGDLGDVPGPGARDDESGDSSQPYVPIHVIIQYTVWTVCVYIHICILMYIYIWCIYDVNMLYVVEVHNLLAPPARSFWLWSMYLFAAVENVSQVRVGSPGF